MAINFQKIYEQIQEIGAGAQERKKTLEQRREHARFLLNLHADNLTALRYKVETIKEIDPGIRCALPLTECLDFHASPPSLPERANLIAADGSQILPDRHSPVQYGLINVGAIVMRLNSGEVPALHTDSQILFDDKLYAPSGGPLTESMLALQRDTAERTKLLELSAAIGTEGAPLVTFTDGPIELWGAKDGEDASLFVENLNNYLVILSRLQAAGIITAGYIDKPAADPLIRLLELTEATDEDIHNLREYHPLRGVTDRWLFGDKETSLLGPGERSAVFGFQSKSEKDYRGVLALHFFYLNISADEKNPQIARVDIPRWVVDEPGKLGLLHAVLIQQCRIMGAKPYPYLLHRAHETAVVSLDDKRQVDQILELELRRSGGELGEISGKQSAKERQGRTSY
ncbi:MAG TPA: DNA double-strand break repair nuclease NurA [Anaerolineales bacterium]|jgi:hypothetical protein